LPEESLPTWLLALSPPRPNQAAAWLRMQRPPVVARIEGDRLLLDPRTVLEAQQADLLRILRALPGG
jgi:L-seryl-tRNA(Ser) seleniumtransferase